MYRDLWCLCCNVTFSVCLVFVVWFENAQTMGAPAAASVCPHVVCVYLHVCILSYCGQGVCPGVGSSRWCGPGFERLNA